MRYDMKGVIFESILSNCMRSNGAGRRRSRRDAFVRLLPPNSGLHLLRLLLSLTGSDVLSSSVLSSPLSRSELSKEQSETLKAIVLSYFSDDNGDEEEQEEQEDEEHEVAMTCYHQ